MSEPLNRSYFIEISIECGTATSLFLFYRNRAKSRKNLELRSFYTGRTTSYTGRTTSYTGLTTSYTGLVRQIRKQIQNLETRPIEGRSARKAYKRDFLHQRAHSGVESKFLGFWKKEAWLGGQESSLLRRFCLLLRVLSILLVSFYFVLFCFIYFYVRLVF